MIKITIEKLQQIANSINGINYGEWIAIQEKVDLMFACQMLLHPLDSKALINHFDDSPLISKETKKGV
nr:hypothetical protein [uncultured Anaerocolumna sp.]